MSKLYIKKTFILAADEPNFATSYKELDAPSQSKLGKLHKFRKIFKTLCFSQKLSSR